MRQVPHILLIGNGRVSRHFQHYFSLLNQSVSVWSRADSQDALNDLIAQASHVVLLISDGAIEAFVDKHLGSYSGVLVHCSGSLISERVYGAHPLMSFNEGLYSIDTYRAITFVVDDDAPDFTSLFPGFPNQSVRLSKSRKQKYHALCVLSGNFSCILWQKLFSTLEKEFGLPESIAHQYLLQQTQNLITNSARALTGPLVRNDINTIKNNIHALEHDPFQQIYQSFVACYQQLHSEEKI